MCPLNLQTGWRQRMSCTPVDTNGCLSFCVFCCFFVYSSIYYVGIVPSFNEMNYWARAQRGSINTRSTSTFGSFLMMFRQKGVNKNHSNRHFIAVNFPARKGCQWAWKPETKSFTFTGRMNGHYFDLTRRVDGRNITVKCILHVGAFSISSAENTPCKTCKCRKCAPATSPLQPRRMAVLAPKSQIQILILDSSRQGTKHI